VHRGFDRRRIDELLAVGQNVGDGLLENVGEENVDIATSIAST
jgi:hypothetical protein